jgi:hypothetical protein
MMSQTTTVDEPTTLISNRTLMRITATIGFLALLVAGIAVIGKHFGGEFALGGNTDSTELRQVIIGQDVLSLPDNMIRFEQQRRTGRAEIVSIYLSWPGLRGYSREEASIFSSPKRPDRLIFVDFTQSVMSRDMSGRIEPIYQKLFEGGPLQGPAGLTIHKLADRSGFASERLLTARMPDGRTYAVRCILPASPVLSTAADCQRDVQVGRDLTMLYRFSSLLLDDWQKIDSAMTAFANAHIVP